MSQTRITGPERLRQPISNDESDAFVDGELAILAKNYEGKAAYVLALELGDWFLGFVGITPNMEIRDFGTNCYELGRIVGRAIRRHPSHELINQLIRVKQDWFGNTTLDPLRFGPDQKLIFNPAELLRVRLPELLEGDNVHLAAGLLAYQSGLIHEAFMQIDPPTNDDSLPQASLEKSSEDSA